MSAALQIQFDDIEGLSSDKQKVFVMSYVTHWNATKAALDAGYSEDTAGSQGSYLLKHPDIQALIEDAKVQISQHFGKSKEAMVKFLLDVLTFDISDVVEIKDDGSMYVNPKNYKKYGRFFKGVEMTRRGIKVTMYPKETAFEQLAKHTDFFRDDNVSKAAALTMVQYNMPTNGRERNLEHESAELVDAEVQKPSGGIDGGDENLDSKTLGGVEERKTF